MKKTYISYLNNCTEVESCRYDGSEAYALYVGLDDAIYGGWLLETGGDPCALNDLEERICDGCEGVEILLNSINGLIADPATPWEDLVEEDVEYLNDWFETIHSSFRLGEAK